jgi:hypothetical protein
MTTFPAVIDRLMEILTEAFPEPEYQVNDGAAPEYGSSFNGLYTDINVGWSPDADASVSEIVPEGLAGSGRESYSVRCTINSFAGDMNMKLARDESMKVYNICRNTIRPYPWNRMVDGVMRVYIGLVSYDASFNEGAAISTIQFNVTVEGFADRGP